MTLHDMLRAVRALTLAPITLAALGFAAPALAQDGSADIEAGATTASYSTSSSSTTSSSDGLRIGLQIRLDALNVLGPADTSSVGAPGTGGINTGAQVVGRRLLVPLAAAGVRFLEQRLFLGAGFGFYGWSTEDDPGNEASQSGFGLSPLAQFDVLREPGAALSLGGALHFASVSESETCDPDGDCNENDDGGTGVGLSLGAGVRGIITPGLALGGDFGWGFLSISTDNDSSVFVHGIFAAIMLEATIGV